MSASQLIAMRRSNAAQYVGRRHDVPASVTTTNVRNGAHQAFQSNVGGDLASYTGPGTDNATILRTHAAGCAACTTAGATTTYLNEPCQSASSNPVRGVSTVCSVTYQDGAQAVTSCCSNA